MATTGTSPDAFADGASAGRPDDSGAGEPSSVTPQTLPRVARSWFDREVLLVARDLLGAVVRTESPEGPVAVRLTEVEAYRGADDPASHAFRGRSARNEQMFRASGHLYVYRHLGLHHCVNVVTGRTGEASAVLLRAGEVVEGQDLAWRRRAGAGSVYSQTDLAQGPARLAVALGLDIRANGADLVLPPGHAPVSLGLASAVGIEPARGTVGAVSTGPRVGVGRDGSDPHLFPWRLWLDGEPTVTRYRAGFR
ncbi:DNA-3-methyladenine glycosylase [Luteimicrobium subarcticum]|uniref:Putative 3-methyladenine DNA glycosylase n=1 Tax=Luteimicrobium subarcticum TaxID=620910 RepID=A0A2M8WTR8_9MICO|nr:DNA-3-methyladenine glycosylase [Luteimicrobium subarcticum]PJI94288.1 DNA-3-methyladenine glycosylase [Luteimicrobium subarcticum]